jgi:hypothetical protein
MPRGNPGRLKHNLTGMTFGQAHGGGLLRPQEWRSTLEMFLCVRCGDSREHLELDAIKAVSFAVLRLPAA